MEHAEALELLAGARVGYLSTVRPDGRPHVVVATFALVGERLVTAIDDKPKTTQSLQRLRNVEAGSDAAFLADHYDDGDWSRLWWVRVDGPARVLGEGPTHDEAISALVAKYDQYQDRPPGGPVVAIEIERVTSWASRE